MAAANTDKFKKLARKWVGQIGAGGVSDAVVTTIPLSAATNLPTDTAVVATIDRVSSNGTKTANLEESVIGVVSGTDLINCIRGSEGTAQAHLAGAVVEILVTAKGINDLIDGLLVEHNQDGTHKTPVVTLTGTQELTNKTLTAPTITSPINVNKVTTYTPSASGTVAISTQGIHRITCPAGDFSITITNEVAGQCYLIEVVKDNSATARTITFNDTVTWITTGGTQPTFTTTANGMTTFGLRCTGTSAFEGYAVGSR